MILSRSPLRVSLMGGGSDLPQFYHEHSGHVLTFTINKYVYLAINRPFADEIRLAYSKTEIVQEIGDIKHPIFRESLYSMGVKNKIEIGSFADVPSSGSGLGSSSAFTVALLAGLHTFLNEPTDKMTLATMACDIEINKCGDPIGKQDQFSSAFGGFNEFTFNTDESVKVNRLEISPSIKDNLRSGFFLIYLGFGRGTNQILANQISNLKNLESSTMNLTSELMGLVPETSKALVVADLEHLGHLLDRSWQIKKKLADGISTPEIDSAYQRLIDWGASGGKLLGAGGGGFLFMCVPPAKQKKFKQYLIDNDITNVFEDFDVEGNIVTHA